MATWVAAEAQRRLLGFHVWSSTPKTGECLEAKRLTTSWLGFQFIQSTTRYPANFKIFAWEGSPAAPVTTTCREYTTTTKNHYDHQTIPKATTTPKPEGSEEHGQKQSRWHVTPEQLLQYCYDISLLWVVQKTQHLVQHHMSSQGFIPRRHYQPGLWFCPRNRLRSNHSAAETSNPARMVLPENCWSQIAISRSHQLVLASNNALPGAHQSRSFQTMLVNSPL